MWPEHPQDSPGETPIGKSGGAQNGAPGSAMPPDLGLVIEHWQSLTDADRKRIRGIVERRLG